MFDNILHKQIMKPRESFLIAINGGTPDRVPIYEHLFSRKLLKEQLDYPTELNSFCTMTELYSVYIFQIKYLN